MPVENIKEQITAILNHIVFSGANNFIIGKFTESGKDLKQSKKFSGLGNILNPQIDQEYKLTGEWSDNGKYGPQFKFSSFQTVEPVTENGIFKYIVRICKFVGPSVGNAIINEFGAETLNVMRNNPDVIASSIKNITLEKAKSIQKTLLENKDIEKLMVELETLLDTPGMPKNIIEKLIERYKSNAVEVVKSSPYSLMEFRGVSFMLADRVAIQNGVLPGSLARKKAVAVHCMQETMRNGNTWIEHDDLIDNMRELVPVKKLEDGILELLFDETFCSCKVWMENFKYPCEHYSFSHVDEAENVISDRICELLKGDSSNDKKK